MYDDYSRCILLHEKYFQVICADEKGKIKLHCQLCSDMSRKYSQCERIKKMGIFP